MTNPVPAVLRRFDALQRSKGPLAFVYAVVKKYGTDNAGSLAALITYYGFLSLFPLLLLAVTVVGLLAGGSHHLAVRVESSALAQFPIIGTQIKSNVHGLASQSGIALAVGIFGLVWGSLGASQAGQHAMAEVWNLPYVDRPGYVPRLLRSLLLLALLAVFLVVSNGLAGVSTWLGVGTTLPVRAGAAAGSALVDIGLFLGAFRVLTPKAVPTGAFVPGAVVGGIAWSVLQEAGTYLLLHQLRHANQVYGLFGLVLGLLWWIYLAAQVLLYTAEINVVRHRRLWPQGLNPPLTSADRAILVAYAVEQRRRPEQRVVVEFDSQQGDGNSADGAPAGRESGAGRRAPPSGS